MRALPLIFVATVCSGQDFAIQRRSTPHPRDALEAQLLSWLSLGITPGLT